MRAPIFGLLFVASCSVSIPNGELRCADDEPCPPGYACIEARCYAPGTDVGAGLDGGDLDAGVLDGGGLDASADAAGDAGSDAPTPVEVFTDVACGNAHTCAITSAGRLFCWGDDRAGQIGEDTIADTIPLTAPALVRDLAGVDEVALGDDFSCARAGGSIYCWGKNDRGQLGDAAVVAAGTASPHLVPSFSGATALAVGAAHACAITGGGVRCWGEGGAGRIGNGSASDQRTPVSIPLPAAAIDVVAGVAHTCALTDEGTVYCWGNDTRDELGVTAPPVDTESRVPVLVTGLPEAIDAIDAFARHTCVRSDARLHCWGWNDSAELGSGARFPTSSATPIEATVPAGDVGDFGGGGAEYAFGGAHTCSIVGSALYCWGRGLSGEVGTGTTPLTPIAMPSLVGLSAVDRVAGGVAHTCAVADGAVYCWGANDRGRLGNGSETASSVPGEAIRVP